MPKTSPLLTSFQVAVVLGKSPRTVQRMAEQGDLPVVQKLPGPNGAFLFDEAAIQKLADLAKAGAE